MTIALPPAHAAEPDEIIKPPMPDGLRPFVDDAVARLREPVAETPGADTNHPGDVA